MQLKYWIFLLIAFFSEMDASIVCIHGFLGAPWNMRYLVKQLEKKDFDVINWGYESREKTIEDHAIDLVEELQIIAAEQPGEAIHFVGHSMGCLIVRAAINHPDCPNEAKIGKAVLLAPPNQGASWARLLKPFKLLKKIAKKNAGRQLMTTYSFDHLGDFPPSMQVLVIAGDSGFNPFIVGENDGTLAVTETYLNTPHQHVIVHAGHKAILFNKKAAKLTTRFLEN